MAIPYLPRSGSQAPSPWHAVGQGARGIGSMLMQIAAKRQEDEDYEAQIAYRDSRDALEAQRYDATQAGIADERTYSRGQDQLATQRYDADRAEEDRRYYEGLGREGFDVRDATASTQAQLPMPGQMLSETVMRSGPQTYAVGDYDPSRDVSVQRTLATREPEQVNWQTVETPQGYEQINPRSGASRPVMGGSGQLTGPPPAASTRGPSAVQVRTSALYGSGQQGYDTLERLIASGQGTPGMVRSGLSKVPFVGNALAGDELRQLRQAATQLSDSWLRFTSGQAVPEQEVERFAQTFTPQPGDDEGTLQQKSNSRRGMIDALREAAGAGISGEPGADAYPDFEFTGDPDEDARRLLGGR